MIARDYLGDYLGDYLNVIKKIKFFQKKRPPGGGQAAEIFLSFKFSFLKL